MKKIISLILAVSILLSFGISYADEPNRTNELLETKVSVYIASFPDNSPDKTMFLQELDFLREHSNYNEDAIDELYMRYKPFNISELPVIEPEEIVTGDENVDESTIIHVTEEETEQNQTENEMILNAYEEMLEGLSYDEAIELGFDKSIVDKLSFDRSPIYDSSIKIKNPSKNISSSPRLRQISDSSSTMSKAPMIVSGRYFNIYLRSDGTVWTWGRQDSYPGLLPTMDINTVPTKIDSLSSIIDVAACEDYALALSSIGAVFAWGDYSRNGFGSRDPVIIDGLENIVSIDAGVLKSVALKSDGTVYEWTTGRFSAEQVMENATTPLTNIKDVAAGNLACYALTSEGKVLSWGSGNLGAGTNVESSVYPINVVDVTGSGTLSNIIAISASSNVLALKGDGTVVTWGNKTAIGHNASDTVKYPIVVKDADGISNLTDVVSVCAGHSNSAVIKNDGSIYVWGNNDWLGDGTSASQFPVELSNISNVVSVSIGFGHIITLKNDGSLWGMGQNGDYQLGIGRTYSNYARQMYNISNVVQIDAFGDYSAAVRNDGTVWTWGRNDYGQLGDGTTQDTSIPTQVVDTQNNPLTNIVMVKVCERFSFALTSDGEVWSWGYNVAGSLGHSGSGVFSRASKVLTAANQELQNIVSIGAGGFYGAALDEDGNVWTWGWGASGRLGHGDLNNRTYATQISSLSNITAISCGTSHMMALDENNEVWSWGYNSVGQLGVGTYDSIPVPTPIATLSNIEKISAGSEHSTALDKNGTVWIWGNNAHGELGSGAVSSPTPLPSEMPLTNIEKVDAGYNHTLALDNNGEVWAWGKNTSGQVSNDLNSGNIPTPTKVMTEDGVLNDIIAVSAGASHSLALKANGTVWTWGDNQYGQLGDGHELVQSDWIRIMNTKPTITKFSSKFFHSLALKSDGTVWASGANAYNMLGIGSTSNASTVPSQVLGEDGIGFLNNIISVETGGNASYALTSEGKVYAWGSNNNGELGQPTPSPASFPQLVRDSTGNSVLSDVVSISAGEYHCIVLKNDGSVYSWGDNSYGQLGDGTYQSSDLPVQVSGLNNIISVSTYGTHSLALKSDGTVYAWGNNASGQIGFGVPLNKVNIPAQVKTSDNQALNNIIKISAGRTHNVVLKDDGTVWTWGDNSNGQLGNNSTQSSSFAVQVQTLSDVLAVSAGYFTTYAITQNAFLKAWGLNEYGQLGIGTYSDALVPTDVLNASEVTFVTGAKNCMAYISSTGGLFMSGLNNSGEFGIGSSGNITSYAVPAYTQGISYNDYGYNFASATSIRVNDMITGECDSTNSDYFKLTPDFTGKHTIIATGNVSVSVYDNELTEISPLNNYYTLTSGHNYYIVVSSNSVVPYSFVVRYQNPAPYFSSHIFKSGFVNPTTITSLCPGYVEGNFVVKNDFSEASTVLVVLVLIDKTTNSYKDVALVETTIKPNTTETVTLGLTVPFDYEDYKLKAILWDGRTTMRQLNNDIVFE